MRHRNMTALEEERFDKKDAEWMDNPNLGSPEELPDKEIHDDDYATIEREDQARRADFRAILEESTDLRETRTQLIRENSMFVTEIGAIASEIGYERARERTLAAKGEQPTSDSAGGVCSSHSPFGAGTPALHSTDGGE